MLIFQRKEMIFLKDIAYKVKIGRLMYIFEAALEYLISILVTGSFLATVTKELGISDSLTGIVSSVISLGCLFQLMSIVLRRKTVKKIVIVLSIANQLLFMLLYLIPLLNFSQNIKIGLFLILIFSAYLIYNFAHPKKINWLMSLVDDSERGKFTANKEIISLLAGMVFSFSMGAITDRFAEMGKIKIAFGISAAVVFILMLLHTFSMVFTVEKEIPYSEKASIKQNLKYLLENKNIIKVTVVFVIYYIAHYACIPFYGTYQINELGFSLKYVSLISISGSITRVLVSDFWGRYADKKSFANMVEKCFLFLGISYISVIFAVPSNGKIMFLFYTVFHGIAMGGINSALTNMIFDYVPYEKRADSLAICQATSGTVGFLTTVIISPLISLIQSNNNIFLRVNIYAQQVVSVIGLVFVLFAIIFVRKFIINHLNNDKGDA